MEPQVVRYSERPELWDAIEDRPVPGRSGQAWHVLLAAALLAGCAAVTVFAAGP